MFLIVRVLFDNILMFFANATRAIGQLLYHENITNRCLPTSHYLYPKKCRRLGNTGNQI